MNIPRHSLTALVDMLGTNRQIKMLTLFDCGLADNSMQIICQGLQQSNLIYLDLRQNTFESEGLQCLLRSLIGMATLLTLRLNAFIIEADEVEIMRELFGHHECHI